MKRILARIGVFCFAAWFAVTSLDTPRIAHAAGWSFIGGVSVQGVATNTGTLNTTSANLLVAAVAHNGSITTAATAVSDSQGNTWSLAFLGNGTQTIIVAYCIPTSTSSSHTFQIPSGADSQSTLMVGAFSVTGTPTLTSVNTNHSFATTVLTRTVPSITPSAANALYIAAGQTPAAAGGGTPTLDSGLSYIAQLAGNNSQFGGAFGYVDQSSAAAISPTITQLSPTQWMDICGFYFLATSSGTVVRVRTYGGQ
jgi:hypothetical protein